VNIRFEIEFQKKYRDRLVYPAELREDHKEEFVGAGAAVD